MGSREREVFTELFWKIRNLQYVPDDDEMKALKRCEALAYRGASVAASVAGASCMAVSYVTGLYRMRKGTAIGVSICAAAVAGYYGAKGASPHCLGSLAQLETPMGGELAIILARRCPDCSAAAMSPWASAIVAAGQAAKEWSDTPVEDLDIRPRIATPEAIAALKERRSNEAENARQARHHVGQATSGGPSDAGYRTARSPPPSKDQATHQAQMPAAEDDFFGSVLGTSIDNRSSSHRQAAGGGQASQPAVPLRRRRHAPTEEGQKPESPPGTSPQPEDGESPDQPVVRRRRRRGAGALGAEPELFDPWAARDQDGSG